MGIGWVCDFAKVHTTAGPICSEAAVKVKAQDLAHVSQLVCVPETYPGSIHVNLIPHSGFTSLEMASVKPSTAHLLAQ